ncbi:MAG TPA: WD40 repeat domain-containing protein [Kofleriaceae bacterium]|jgi:WD40 repeat protein
MDDRDDERSSGRGGGRGGGGGGGGGGGRKAEPQFRVQCVAFDPADQTILTGNRDGSIAFWSAVDASRLGRAIPLHDPRMGHVFAVGYRRDSAIVVSGSRDGTVALVDAQTHEPTGARWSVCKGDVFVARFLRDDTLLTAGKDGSIRFWSTSSRLLLGETAAHNGWVYGVANDPDEQTFASVSEDGAAILWRRDGYQLVEPRRLASPLQTMLRRPGGRHTVAISPDGKLVATGSHEHSLIVWDVRTGDAVLGPFKHDDVVLAVAFHPKDPSKLLSAGWDGTIRLWPSGRVLASRLGPVYQVGLSPEGDAVATAGWDFAVRLFELPSGRAVGMRARDEEPVPSGLSFAPDSQSLAVGYRTGDVRVFDPATGAVRATLSGHTDAALLAVFSPDSSLLATSGFDHSVRIWSAVDGSARALLEGHTDVVRTAVFSPDGKTLASASRDTTIRLWDLTAEDPAATARVLRWHKDAVRCVTFSPDGKLLATASKDRTGRLWNVEAGEPIGAPLEGHRLFVRWVAFSPDGSIVATASDDGDIRLWNVPDGTQRGDVLRGHTDWVQCLAFSPDGKQLASASGHPGDERAVRRWDVATGTQLGEPLLGHTAMLTWVAYSNDGNYLASASHDGTVRIWDPKTGMHVRTL